MAEAERLGKFAPESLGMHIERRMEAYRDTLGDEAKITHSMALLKSGKGDYMEKLFWARRACDYLEPLFKHQQELLDAARGPLPDDPIVKEYGGKLAFWAVIVDLLDIYLDAQREARPRS